MSSEETKLDYQSFAELMQLVKKRKQLSAALNNLSSPKENNQIDSVIIQSPEIQSCNNRQNTASTKLHHKKHRKQRDEASEKRHHRSRHKEETKSADNADLFTNTASRHYKEQSCMDGVPRDDRCAIPDKKSEHRTHRYRGESEIPNSASKRLIDKHSLDCDEDVDDHKRKRRHRESIKHEEIEKRESILQGSDISKRDGYKTEEVDSLEKCTSENENIEQMLQIGEFPPSMSQKVEVNNHTTVEKMKIHSILADSHLSDSKPETNNQNNTTDTEITRISDESHHLFNPLNNQYELQKVAMESIVSLEEKLQSQSESQIVKENRDNEHKKQRDDRIKLADMPPYYPAIQGCRSVNEFTILNHINEGTYGVVYRAIDKHCGEIVALKRLKMENESEGFPITSLREINTLLKGQHPNIITVREIVMGTNLNKIFIVMDYVEHDLKSLIDIMRHRKQSFTAAEVKCLLKQLLLAVAYLHDNWILHRDLKTSNLLLSENGVLKVGDFGLAREYGSPLRAYTPIVVTLWYRAPELLLSSKLYSTHIDVWSVGCIFGELVLMTPVFQGKSDIDQLFKIFKILGTPNDTSWPGFSKLPTVQRIKLTQYPPSNLRSRFSMLTVPGQALLQGFLTYDPTQRITAQEALDHPYFREFPLPIDPSMFPSWPTKGNSGKQRTVASGKVPEGSKQLDDKDAEGNRGFRINPSVMENRELPTGGGFNLKF